MIIIDRFEGDYAYLEYDEETRRVERTSLPAEAKEGDLLIKTDQGWQVDKDATQRRRQALAQLRHSLLAPDKGHD